MRFLKERLPISSLRLTLAKQWKMLSGWWNLLKTLSDRPEVDKLASFLHALVDRHGEELEFVVLFGSMARGNWSRGSDYDLLIGLRDEDDKRLIDRMAEFSPPVDTDIEVFPYDRGEWQRMFREYHPLLLEALEYGVVLWDRGAFADMRGTFRQWRESDRVQPWRSGWKITDPEA